MRIACNDRRLAHFGGVHLFHQLLRVLQLLRFLAQHPIVEKENTAAISQIHGVK
jgi:hypothetical protein